MPILTRTLQEMRQDLAQMMDDNYTGVADTGSTTTFMLDTMLSTFPNDHFNGWELSALFATVESRIVTDFTKTGGSVDFSPAMSSTIGVTNYEMHREFTKLQYDSTINQAIRSVADVALIDYVDDSISFRQGLQGYPIPNGFVYIYDVQSMKNASDGIVANYAMGQTPADLVLGSSGIQNYMRLAQSFTNVDAVTFCPAVALLLRNSTGDTIDRDMRVAIYSDSSGAPSAALYISEPVSSTILNEVPHWIRFSFKAQAMLAANTRYHIVLYDGDTDAATRYGWAKNQDGRYNSESVYGYYSTQGVRQIETLTVVGAAVTAGGAMVTVTAAGMQNSPVTISVPLLAGDTATLIAGKVRTALAERAPEVVNFFTIGGTGATVQLTTKAADKNDDTMNIAIADGSWNGITPVPFSTNTTAGTTAGTKQVETATVVGTITAGTAQVETATVVVPTYIIAGTAQVTVTAAGMTNSPVTVQTASLPDFSTASQVAAAIRTALTDNAPDVSNFFTISGAGANVVLTTKTKAADDATMNIATQNGTCEGITAAPTSTHTTAGVASGAGTVSIIVAAAGMTGTPVTSTDVIVTAGETATQVATEIATQLTTKNANISNFFTITSNGADVLFTTKTAAANDATMNIAINNGTCAGLTAAPTSANTTAGVAATTGVKQVETLTVVGTVNGSGVLQFTVTAAGMTGVSVTGIVNIRHGETAVQVAAKLRSRLVGSAEDDDGHSSRDAGSPINSFFIVTGTDADVVLTARVSTTNDTTMNLAIANPTLTGLTAVPTSTNTTAGEVAITGAWTSLSTTTGQAFMVYGGDPDWESISPNMWSITRSATRTIYINRALIDGTPIRLLGFKAPDTMSLETDTCPINADYVLAKAAAFLCASKIRRSDNDPDAYAMQARFWDEQSERIRGRVRTRLPANARLVEVQ